MTGYLPKNLLEELGISLRKKPKHEPVMTVLFNNKHYPIVNFSKESFSILGSHEVKLRGLVDIHSNDEHVYQALIVASEINHDLIVFNFKRNTFIQSGPALDFEIQESVVAGLLPSN
ncbi:MAG: hypothetical protein ACI8Y9_001289 [Paracoccaceae bacterium]|jgi:hypothetical protein